MKNVLCVALAVVMIMCFWSPTVAAAEMEDETFATEEILAMDYELDSDGDGLVDIIEIAYGFNRYNPDTDGDGVTDYIEFCVTCTDVLIQDGDVDTDSDGLTNAQECAYGTNPDDIDTDNDGASDYDEIMIYNTDPLVKDTEGSIPMINITNPNIYIDAFLNENSTFAVDIPGFDNGDLGGSGVYSTTLTTEIATSNVAYTFSGNWFYADNTQYNQEMAVTSSLLSAIAYDENYLGNTSTWVTMPETAVEDWFNLHNFSGYVCYDLDYDEENNPSGYQDQHVSEMFVAYKKLYYGSAKTLICVIIRGTNGTLDEWQSNFDLGSTAEFSYYTEWLNQYNHMGFDITSNRLNEKLNQYISEHNLENDDNVFWLTGHSRGAALANLIAAKRANLGETVFAYTFASPATTTSTVAQTGSAYQCIFNIINEDDLVPQLPMADWGFVRYGVDKLASIENTTGYAASWDALTGGELIYTSNKTKINNVVNTLEEIAANRNSCYVYRTDSDGCIYGYALNSADRDMLCDSIANSYPDITEGCWYIDKNDETEGYSYTIYQKPAFLMRLLATVMGGNASDRATFVTINVAAYLEDAKVELISASMPSVIEHPHYVESYYLLAVNLS